VVVHVGEPVASKVVNQWIATSCAFQVRIGTEGPLDPDHRTAVRVLADPAAVCIGLAGRVRGGTGTPWLARWRHAERRAQAVYDRLLGPHGALSEPAVARTLTAALPEGGQLVVSSSMPVRDVEWYGVVRAGLAVHANRGANGIDGVVATGLGVAAGTGAPTAVLLGDVALLHDASSLTALARRPVDLLVVVVDNDGGGIFSFLPQAAAVPPERFEALFGTPHGTDLVTLAAAHGLDAERVDGLSAVREAAGAPRTRVVVVPSDRSANVRVHDELHAAVVAALDGR
jgi:2-succinyl-5-enolpyruvyl-6-hydroxy-3-cyclohexene-1-carboxylate synthase